MADDDVNLERIARKMIGMTGADLRNLANEAALIASRESKARIERADFEYAADRVLLGPKRDEVLNEEEKKRTAYHKRPGMPSSAGTCPKRTHPKRCQSSHAG